MASGSSLCFRHIFTIFHVYVIPTPPKKPNYINSCLIFSLQVLHSVSNVGHLNSHTVHPVDVKYLPAVTYKLQHCETVNPDKSWVFQKNLPLLFHCMVFLIIVLCLNISIFSQERFSFRFRFVCIRRISYFWLILNRLGKKLVLL